MQQQLPTIVLVGAPNVGKSLIFNYLTGLYVTVSNYPGTTVDVSRGKLTLDGVTYEVVDTPGIYSLIPMTDEERVTRELLCDGKPKLVIHVIDAKHIRRMTNLTLDLLDGGFPVIVTLNVIDEADRLGIAIDSIHLSAALGAPVLKTAAVVGTGLSRLRDTIREYRFRPLYRKGFDNDLEECIATVGDCLQTASTYGMSDRLAAILLLQGDTAIKELVKREVRGGEIARIVASASKGQNLDYLVTAQRQAIVDRILAKCVTQRKVGRNILSEAIGRLTREPLTGVPILLLVLYLGLYLFVGRFGAGVLVDYFDMIIFGDYLLPFLSNAIVAYIPSQAIQSLIIGEFGIVSLGLRYAIAIILPVVSTFFLAFAILEDSGYLPRLAMLLNTVCRWFGLNGRSVIPLSLGFGCGTMAIMVTRTLETQRERLLATFLLSLAIPCSAQLGVILALLSHNMISLMLWTGLVAASFFSAGFIANKLIPGRQSVFYMELPPIRLPRLGNVLLKAYTRMVWYMREIIPVFIGVSLFLWLAERLGWIRQLSDSFQPILDLLSLPRELAAVFLLGFFRRDYGAAGLYDLAINGTLTEKQLLVAAVALTLFLPCVAQLIVMFKERGVLASLSICALIGLVSFSVAWLVNVLVNPVWL